MAVVAKNGKTFEIPDEFDSATGENLAVKKAAAKGYSEMVDVTKDGSSFFTIPTAELNKALEKGYQTKAKVEAESTKFKQDPGLIESGARGFSEFATAGHSGEIAGLSEGAQRLLQGRGVKNATEAFRATRDTFDEGNDEAWDKHPVAYGAGAAGAIVPQALAGGASLMGREAVKQGAKVGLATGALEAGGRSKADLTKGEFGDYAGDVGIGAGAGFAFGAGGAVAGEGIGALARNRGKIAAAAGGALERGNSAGKEAAKDLPAGLDGIAYLWTALKQGGKGAKEAWENASQLERAVIQEMNTREIAAAGARKVVPMGQAPVGTQTAMVAGAGKTGDTAGNDDFFEALSRVGMDEVTGESPLLDWVAHNSATFGPNNRNPEVYKEALRMGSERRLRARDANPEKVGKDLEGAIEGFEETFTKQRDEAFKRLQNQAADTFELSQPHLDEVVKFGDSLLAEGGHSVIPAKNQAELRKALEALEFGAAQKDGDAVRGVIGAEHFGLTPGHFTELHPADQFKRLQFVREAIDEQRSYFAAQGQSKAEQLMLRFRKLLDNSLKMSEPKTKADELMSRGLELEKKFFGEASFRNKAGRTEIDAPKLERLLGNNDTAKRFKDSMKEMQQYYADLGSELGDSTIANKAIEALENAQSMMADKRLLESLRQHDGPSGPAIKMLGFQMQKFKIDTAAITDPAGYLNMLDRSVRAYGKQVGTVPNWMSRTLARFSAWSKAHPKATPAQVQRAAEAAGVPRNLID